MERARLGRTDLEISRIAFGTWELGGEWGTVGADAAIDAIRRAWELGINVFDTAQGYGFGASERLLATALREPLDHVRSEVVVATKGGLRQTPDGLVRDSSPLWLRLGVEQSLVAMGIDHIDLYQVHWPDPRVPLADTAGALLDLVDEGLIRHVGLSNFDVEQIAEFARGGAVETLQPPYHLFRQDAAKVLLPFCRQHDIGVLVYGALAHGLLSGALSETTMFAPDDWRRSNAMFQGEQFATNLAVVRELQTIAADLAISVSQLAVAWVLGNPAVDAAILGTRNARHITEIVAAAGVMLDVETRARIDAAVTHGVPVGGPAPESMP
ncbi:MAG TPA: aldo/keto reductase [Acidimicrobiia bacterium]|jgi:hypothetical protein|nr:aldo/keto reductase [Acidimicrobiia bacterium]